MNIYDEIREALAGEWKNGTTQRQMAERAGVTDPYINKLISGKQSIGHMMLDTLFKLFPGAQITLGSRSIGNSNVISGNARVQSDNYFFGNTEEEATEKFRRKLMDAIIANEELSDEERGRFLRIIRSVKYNG